ncbi:uncharacterized protein [Macrobrachium rosenbergii]|uniref:uncharacterized protein n=1 Tax=Macrobrachium rosenbergii TaxID=79674 RepID=UPI0034D3E70D
MDVKIGIELRYWTSICIAIDLDVISSEVVQDGDVLVGRKTERGSSQLLIRGGGQLFIGQEQDNLGGGFNEFQSLRGSIADLRIYGKKLETEKMRRYTSCQSFGSTQEPLLDFRNISTKFEVSEVEIEDVNGTALCVKKKQFDFIFPESRLFDEAELLCRTLGGRMKVPVNRHDNKELYELASLYSSSCAHGNVDTLWLGVRGNETDQSFYNTFTKKKVTYINFEKNGGRPIEEPETCIAFKGSKDIVETARGAWLSKECNQERCVACHFPRLPFVRIRGLCGKSEFDRHYFISDENNTINFVGAYYSQITRHPPMRNDSKTGDFGYWMMSRIDKPEISAKLYKTSPTHYPTGENTWEVENDLCGKNVVTLRMTSCKEQEFSCNDGTCITLPQRCNMEANCLDGSDEIDCSFLVLPQGYDQKKPPPRQNQMSPVNVSIHTAMLSVRAFDLTGFNFVVEVEVRISWHDARLSFHHLNDADFLNLIHLDDESQMPWMPTVEFLGDAFTTSDITDRRSTLLAHRVTMPLDDDDERLLEDEIFEGKDNPLVLLKKLTVKTSCQFDLITFPFDTQTCRLGVVLSGVTKDYISLVADGKGVSYLGNRKLLEYFLAEEKMIPHDEGNFSGQAVELTFKNLSTFYVTSTYIPTFIIVVIGYLVFFFPVEDFNERVMVALTALLVEAAFFTQMSSSIPQTAYLKLVDIWFVYCIISLFLVVVTVVFINWCKKSAPGCLLGVGKYSTRSEARLTSRRTALAARLNTLCRVVCPILTALFFVFYLTMAALIDIPKLPIDIKAIQFT